MGHCFYKRMSVNCDKTTEDFFTVSARLCVSTWCQCCAAEYFTMFNLPLILSSTSTTNTGDWHKWCKTTSIKKLGNYKKHVWISKTHKKENSFSSILKIKPPFSQLSFHLFEQKHIYKLLCPFPRCSHLVWESGTSSIFSPVSPSPPRSDALLVLSVGPRKHREIREKGQRARHCDPSDST